VTPDGKYTYLLNVCANLIQQTVYSKGGVPKSCNTTTEVCIPAVMSSASPCLNASPLFTPHTPHLIGLSD